MAEDQALGYVLVLAAGAAELLRLCPGLSLASRLTQIKCELWSPGSSPSREQAGIGGRVPYGDDIQGAWPGHPAWSKEQGSHRSNLHIIKTGCDKCCIHPTCYCNVFVLL